MVSSNQMPLSQLWGTCGVAMNRSRWVPRSSGSSPITTGGRSARSFSETMHASAPCTTSACGAPARKWFIAPHSSASTWANEIQRSESTGTIRPIASDTSGCSARIPVWNRNGCSSLIRNWLNEKPPGATSSITVESRNTSGAISSILVSISIGSLPVSGTGTSGCSHDAPPAGPPHRGKPPSAPRFRGWGNPRPLRGGPRAQRLRRAGSARASRGCGPRGAPRSSGRCTAARRSRRW